MILNGIPNDGLVNNIIAVYQDVPESDYAAMFGDPFKTCVIDFLNPVKGFSNNLKIPFHCSLYDGLL